MNLNQLPLCIVCAALGAGLVKVADRMVPEDNITAKSVVVTDDEGKAFVRLDTSGVQVIAEGQGTYTQIKAGDRPQIDVVKEGSTVMTLGESHRSNGVHLYRDGKTVGFMAANDGGTAFAAISPTAKSDSIEEMLNGSDASTVMEAQADKKVYVGVRSGELSKGFVLPEPRE